MSGEQGTPGLDRVGVVAVAAGLAVVCGMALPVAIGWALPLAAIAVTAVVATVHARTATAWVESGGGWAVRWSQMPVLPRAAIVALTVLPAAVVAATLGRALGALLVAFPASLWGLLALALGVIALRWATARARVPTMVGIGLAVALAGVFGQRFEDEGPEARGWAHSGPILGIHPFQTTAIRIDGLGPYDLPLNDYVEPDGSRGYGPDELADAIGRALAAIAQQHYADGPVRARRAFADARVESVVTPSVYERLDREPSTETVPRFVVYSGTTGQGSRVEFVCPGKQDDPTGMPEEHVLKRMCPNKYVSEASAGLGVTGRWTGYAEGRGNERVGLSRWLGWTRSDDEVGRHAVAREIRWWAWLLTVVAWATVAWAAGRWGRQVTTASVGVGALAFAVGAALLLTSGLRPVLAPVEQTPGWLLPDSPAPWLPVAVVAFAAWAGGRGPRSGASVTWLGAAAVAVGTLAVGRTVAADAWVRPDLAGSADALPLSTWVRQLAETIGERAGLSIFEVESVIACIAVAIVAGALVGMLSGVTAIVGPTRRRDGLLASLGVVAVACALVVSRKTAGGTALVPVAMAAATVLSSGLWAWSGSRSLWRAAMHALVVALALLVTLRTVGDLPSHLFVTLCTVVSVAVLLGGLVLSRRTETPPSDPAAKGSSPPSEP